METQISKQKVAAVIRSFENWIKDNTDYVLPINSNKLKNNAIPYERWYCGITKFENGERLKQHIKSKGITGLYYKQLELNSKEEANMIEAHFSRLGTNNAPEARGAKKESRFAYIFKEKPNFLEKILIFLNQQ